MAIDKVTEMIAHLIGIFHLKTDEVRMRDDYEKLSAFKAMDAEIGPLTLHSITFNSKFSLEGFVPKLGPLPSSPLVLKGNFDAPYFGVLPMQFSVTFSAAPSDSFIQPSFFNFFTSGRPILTIEPPSSVAVVSEQSSYLLDDDLLITDEAHVTFNDIEAFHERLEDLQQIAATIGAPFSANALAPGEDARDDAVSLYDQMQQATVPIYEGANATLMRGDDIAGIIMNGAASDEAPELDDLMPEFFAEAVAEYNAEGEGESTDGTATAETEGNTTNEIDDPFKGLESLAEDGELSNHDGHAVVAGANTLVNEVFVSAGWLDAPVIAVMNDVVDINMIAQTNVLSDTDFGAMSALHEGSQQNTLINVSQTSMTATTPEPVEGEEEDGAQEIILPSNWAVTHIEGDLISYNYTSQSSFFSDNDRTDVSFESSGTLITTGQNTSINLASMIEIGFGYDLIIVGGSMISVNWLSQTNVVLDDDSVTYTGVSPEAVSGSDNLLYNSATLNSVGVDSYTELQENFAEAGAAFADGAESIDESVAHDALFEGDDILTVLNIEGDLTTVNWVEQTNVLGDADQVHLTLDNFLGQVGNSVEVTTGSNAAINIATLNDYGVDSTVQVGGDVYSDALLVQADLIDTSANPLGVAMPSLATEAVAFLADGFLDPFDLEPELDVPIVPTAPEASSPDVLQTMLA